MKVWQQGILAILVAVAVGCDTGTGPNSLYTFKPETGCTACHSASISSSLDPLVTNGSGTAGKHLRHVQVRAIPCERCHNGYFPAENHMNGMFDTTNPAFTLVLFDSTNPTATWTGDTGPGTGTCASVACHGGASLDWYAAATACSACHSVPQGARRQVTGASGDFASNPSISSHHISGANDPTPEQCQVCHEMSQHMSGTVRLKEADTGAAIVFSASSPSTLEPFCLSCHDADGSQTTYVSGGSWSTPFNDGSMLGIAPYPYAMRIKTSWTSTNGHGPNGNHATIKKLTCLGSGQPGTGCHGTNGTVNGHGSVNHVLAALPFNYENSTSIYNAAEFELCFNCHANYPGFTKEDTLGVKQSGLLDGDYGWLMGGNGPNGWNPPYYTFGLATKFADHNEFGGAYNDTGTWWGPNANLHWAHLGFPASYFRGTGSTSGINCVNCHDVHGSNMPFGALYDEIGYSHVFPDATNILGKMTDNAYLPSLNQLDLHPTYCGGFNCHAVQGPTRAWLSPIIE